MSKTREQQVCKEMVLMSMMAAIESLLIAYQAGGLIRLVLSAGIGIFVFKMIAKTTANKCDFRDFCMTILCGVAILLTSGQNDYSFTIIILGMSYAGVSGALAICQE